MQQLKAEFIKSSPDLISCPPPHFPEYAFIGRSNVGKSSLINMLTYKKDLAKTSGKPGKTRLINHFLIDKAWYLVDLPGYGYAGVSKEQRLEFEKMIQTYCSQRENLVNLFVLIDSRLEPQQIDLEFMQWLGETEIPFVMVFTKIDKLSSSVFAKNKAVYEKKLLEQWEEVPIHFSSSSVGGVGREEIVQYIQHWNSKLAGSFKNKGQ